VTPLNQRLSSGYLGTTMITRSSADRCRACANAFR
jgi:hypothetical protein